MTTDLEYPTNKVGAALFLVRAGNRLTTLDYNDCKAKQLFTALFDLLIAETVITSWLADLGFKGCDQGEDSSIGGIPCHSSQEI